MLKLGLVIGVAVLVAASALSSVGSAGHAKRCFGKRPDINRSHDPSGSFLVGTARQDVIIASEDADHIEGRGGPDLICARGNSASVEDEVLGGAGPDKLSGGRGGDIIHGGAGDDLLHGGPGRDRGRGGPGRDTCVDIEIRTSCEVVR